MNTLMRKELQTKRTQIMNLEFSQDSESNSDFLLETPPPPPPRELLDSPTSIIMENINNFSECENNRQVKRSRQNRESTYIEISDEVVNGNALYSISHELKKMNVILENKHNSKSYCSTVVRVGFSFLGVISLIAINNYILLEYLN